MPVTTISPSEILNTFSAALNCPLATFSDTMMEMAIGMPADETESISKKTGYAIWYRPMPSPPKKRDNNMRLTEPRTLTIKPAMVKIIAPRKNLSAIY